MPATRQRLRRSSPTGGILRRWRHSRDRVKERGILCMKESMKKNARRVRILATVLVVLGIILALVLWPRGNSGQTRTTIGSTTPHPATSTHINATQSTTHQITSNV